MKITSSAIRTARNLTKKGFLVIDTETTGISKDAEICEIAVLDQDGNLIFYSLIKPSKPIPDNVIAIHGISNEMVQDAPIFSDIAMNLLQIISNKNLIAHNAYFDRKRLDFEFSRCGFSLNATWNCTMLLTTPKGQKWNKLSEALEQFNINLTGIAHRAIYDAECCRQIVFALSKQPIFFVF